MKKSRAIELVCLCFMFAAMTLSYAYMIRTNRWERFAHKCEVINMHHLTIDILLDNRGGWMLTPKGFYRIKDISLEKWAKMPDRANVIIINEKAIKQMQINFGMGEKEIK